MKKKLALWLDKVWYKDRAANRWLLPLSLVYLKIITIRRFLYRSGWLKQHTLPVPVVIVGNITVGGTGKTPLIIWLAQRLKAEGFKPGIISRGYGGKAEDWPQRVTSDSDTRRVGDEAVLLATRAGCPVAVGPERIKTAELLLNQERCDVILSDDGLQHYALARDIEIAVIDGERQFGNGLCLPAGPLREPKDRMDEVDFVVVNGTKIKENQFSMQLKGGVAINMASGEVEPLPDFADSRCHAVAGIGNPGRFYKLLNENGIDCIVHTFPDHHPYQPDDIEFHGGAVLMTEKDAVKCKAFARHYHWYVPVESILDPEFSEQFLNLLREKNG